MDYINIAVFSKHKLINEGLCSLVESVDGLKISLKESSMDKLLKNISQTTTNILILHLDNLGITILKFIENLKNRYAKLQILILSSDENEENILKTIKAGAKGYLAKDSGINDLLEAIYTLRAGHDYYSKSITQLLLNKYINGIQTGENSFENRDIKCLSSRELEVLKLWGNSYTNSEISEKLFISVRTVESHKNHIMQKLNMKTAVDLVKFSIRNNIIKI